MLKNTESSNPESENLDQLSSLEIVELFTREDKKVIEAIAKAKNEIAESIEIIYQSLAKSGRLFYLGAGSSGRIGVLDASECPPTFSTDPEMVQGLIAGGKKAITTAVEGAEDDAEAGAKLIKEKLNSKDVLVGISANGGAPFVIAALKKAKEIGAETIAIANNLEAKIFKIADRKIFLDTGPEILAGSTRLKAGSSQKMVLNILSTATMVKLGKVYKNLMVDLQATNSKLMKRAVGLVSKIAECDEDTALNALQESNLRVKQAVLKILKNLDFDSATKLLRNNGEFLSKVLFK